MGSAQLSLLDNAQITTFGDSPTTDFGPAPLPDHLAGADRKQAETLLATLWDRCEEAMKDTVRELWDQKRNHYTSERLLIRNISKRVMVSRELIEHWRHLHNWPGVITDPSAVLPRPTNWRTVRYIDDDENLDDPLEAFVKRVFRTSKHQALWGRYCRVQGVLLPEDIDTRDIRYVLENAPISNRIFYRLFQQDHYAFAPYLDYCGLDVRRLNRHPRSVSLNRLLTCNARIRHIVAVYAQALYTNRGVPIRAIAERLELDPVTLWAIGDERTAWRLPTQSTLHHLINESVLRSFV
ncbi:MAG: Uncharacterized protein AWU57_1016 [Marinobacter sp. T13-3]|nr:MAG: Uncharacterized protein AWU57_1016 [Marinobacter sp. T13-3]